MSSRWCAWAFAVGVLMPCACGAQELARSIDLTVDNDFFEFTRPPRERSDDNYTQGARLTWDTHRVPRFARRLACAAGPCGLRFEFGQEMYTPEYGGFDVPGDRPFAGWLYVQAQARGAGPGSMQSVSVTLGLTGPASLAGTVQRAFHHLVPAFYEPVGWERQLPTELAFAVSGQRAWRVAPAGRAASIVDVVPTVTGTAGTLRMSFGAGVRARLGTRLTHPWLSSPAGVAPYGFAGLSGEAVGRDLFLDGTTFRASAHVAHEAAIAEWERGIGVRIFRLGVEYRVVTRTRAFPAAERTHTYGALHLAWTLR